MGNLAGEFITDIFDTAEQFEWWLCDSIEIIRLKYPAVTYKKGKNLPFDATIHFTLYEAEVWTGTVDLTFIGNCWKIAFYQIKQALKIVSEQEDFKVEKKDWLPIANWLCEIWATKVRELSNNTHIMIEGQILLSTLPALNEPRELIQLAAPIQSQNRPKKRTTQTQFEIYAKHYYAEKAKNNKHTQEMTAEYFDVSLITVKRAITFYRKKYQKVSEL